MYAEQKNLPRGQVLYLSSYAQTLTSRQVLGKRCLELWISNLHCGNYTVLASVIKDVHGYQDRLYVF